MRIKSTQLDAHLKKHGLSSLYLFTGDEPLQIMECSDTLRQFACHQGFNERDTFMVDSNFAWESLQQQANSLSLFSNKRLLEVNLGDKSPGESGGKILVNYAENPPPDVVLLLTAAKLDGNKQKSKWFTIFDERGIIIQVWDIELAQLPDWIAKRMATHGLQASPEAIALIAERSEGHLLACAQEIEKLRLLYGTSAIDVTQVMEAVADSARFAVFNWVDIVLSGDIVRSVRQLYGLRSEGYETVLISWALEREIRQLCHISYALQTGQPLELVFKTHRVWQQKKAIVEKALKRHSLPKWWRFLQKSVQIDRIIKGVDKGNAWDELQKLSTQVAGLPSLL